MIGRNVCLCARRSLRPISISFSIHLLCHAYRIAIYILSCFLGDFKEISRVYNKEGRESVVLRICPCKRVADN